MAINMSDAEWNKLIEAVGVLAGWRGDKDKTQAAVRRADLQNIDKLLGNLKGSSSSIDTQLKAINQQLQTLSLNVSSLRGDVDDNASDISALQGIVQTLQQSLTSLQQTVNSQGQAINQLVTDVGTAQSTATAAKNDIDNAQSRVQAITIGDPTQDTVTAPPTAAQFNGVVADIGTIFDILTEIKAAIVG